jgi:hypothetical protein
MSKVTDLSLESYPVTHPGSILYISDASVTPFHRITLASSKSVFSVFARGLSFVRIIGSTAEESETASEVARHCNKQSHIRIIYLTQPDIWRNI